ncbi:tetratricopeptide repeat-containing sulfotransferase family protein [Herbaspirillum sp. YR522]|uniref:tetratricopeptide repeat-containing sulfotransferase family protein n=1 Tax=Herbaspirillum sp. YR522 TaxID=1144342 RepID=UPI00026F4B21|nr:tetratricopeptide repeat-containing sulfotransferase family protein [Herbaspirillum sp. YR522]EJM97462.1 Tfp pilus assembly protein PilF [Herbaspirillum sp. YR522]
MSDKRSRPDRSPPPLPSQLTPLAEAARLTSALTRIDQSLETAYAHWRAGQPAQASMLCEQVLQVAPLHAPALHLLGLMAHAEGNIADALRLLELTCAQPGASADFHSNNAEVSRQAGLLGRAQQAARKALALSPGHPAASCNLGIILQQAGQLDASAELLTAAAAAAPDNADVLNNLGNTRQLMGSLDEAMLSYAAAIERDPMHEAAYANLASLQLELGQFDAAAESARQVLDLNPQNIAAYLVLARLHAQRARIPGALREVDKLLSFSPACEEALRLRVDLLLDSGDLLAAEEAMQALPGPRQWRDHLLQARLYAMRGHDTQALAATGRARDAVARQEPVVSIAHAQALARTGQAEQACLDLGRLLDQVPSSATAWQALAELTGQALAPHDIDRLHAMREQGRQQGRGWRDSVALHRAWGHAMLAGGDGDAALAAYGMANALEARAHPFDAGQFAALVEHSIASWSLPATVARNHATDSPVFVLGMPHCGADLIRSMLCGGAFAGQDRYDLMGHILASLAQDQQPLASSLEIALELSDDDYAELAQYYLDCAAPTDDLVDACHVNSLLVGFIVRVFPAARFIVCRRDPVETCLAGYREPPGFGPAFPRALPELGVYHRRHERLVQHWTSHLPAGQLLEIDHARLLADPAQVAAQVAAFRGVPCRLPAHAQLALRRREAAALAAVLPSSPVLSVLREALREPHANGVTHDR